MSASSDTIAAGRQSRGGAAWSPGPQIAADPPKMIAVLELPAPRYERRVSLTQALRQRRSTREYSEQDLSTQLLSDLLWSGFGINLFRGALDVQQLARTLMLPHEQFVTFAQTVGYPRT